MTNPELTGIEVATMLITAALDGDRKIIEDEVVRVIVEQRGVAGDAMMHLVVIATAMLKVAAESNDPREFLQANVARWLKERDDFLNGDVT